MLRKITVPVFLILLSTLVSANLIGDQYTTTCQNHICTMVIYAEPVRYKETESFLFGTGGWADVDENFYNETPADCPVEDYDYCAINKYALNVKEGYDVHIETKFQEDYFGYELYAIEYGNYSVYLFEGNVTINGSIASYNVSEGLTYSLQYLPTRVKDTLIIENSDIFDNNPLADTLDVWYKVTDGFTFNRTNDTGIEGNNSDYYRIDVYQDNELIYSVSHIDVYNGLNLLIEQQSLDIETFGNETFFVARLNATALRENTHYPLYIDPLVTVDETAVYNVNLYQLVRQSGGIVLVGYRRATDPPNDLLIGTTKILVSITTNVSYIIRGDVEFNLTGIPVNATLISAYLNVSIKAVGDPINRNISFRHMKKVHTAYPNNFIGNINFYSDCRDGYQYDVLNLTPAMLNTNQQVNLLAGSNITKAKGFIEKKFGKKFFAVGFHALSEPSPQSNLILSSFFPRAFVIPEGRPMLILTYRHPNNSWDMAAIYVLIFLVIFLYTSLNIFFCKNKRYVKKCNT